MYSILGIAIVFLSIIGGFLMEKGKLLVLVQPAELIIIGGAAVGHSSRSQSAAADRQDLPQPAGPAAEQPVYARTSTSKA